MERALAQRRLLAEYRLLKEEAAARRGGPQIIGDSPALRQTMTAIDRAAASDTTVLLEGESGTGKELCARALHDRSPRADGPFVAINCAAIPDTLLEAELFGYERGAFTGANQRKLGRFEMAQRGTIFLDEIGEMPLTRAGQDAARRSRPRKIERLGGGASIQLDVRIVAATNRRLRAGRGRAAVSRGSLLPPVGVSRSRSRRCAIAARTSRSSRTTSSSACRGTWARRSRCRPRRWPS